MTTAWRGRSPGLGGRGRNPHALGHPQGAAHAGRAAACSRTRCTRSAKVAPQHLVVVLGQDRERIAPAVAELADELGRTIDIAVQDQQLGTGHAVGCGLAALPERLRRRRGGDLRRRPAAGRRHAGRPDRHPQRRTGRRDRADHRRCPIRPATAASCDPGRRGHRRSSSRPTPRPSQRPSARSTPASTPSTSPRCARR